MSPGMWANRLTAAFGASPGIERGSRPTAGPQEPMMSVVSDDRYFGVYPAVVTSNNDPFGFGRVQVTVPMVATNDALWATVVVPCTGQDGGFPPAVGTDVVVAFAAGDPGYAYVLGTFSRW
jgi:uncharacterized protein involved in type VI secretion and phage assembly